MTREQIRHLFGLMGKAKSRSADYLHGFIKGKYGLNSIKELSNEQYEETVRDLEKQIYLESLHEASVTVEDVLKVFPGAVIDGEVKSDRFGQLRDKHPFLRRARI